MLAQEQWKVGNVATTIAPFGGPRFVVLDSGVIYDDIVYRLRHPDRTTVLLRSAQSGATRLFAGDHVYAEIYDRLDGFERRGIDRREFIACFEKDYLPYVRFVETLRWPVSRRVLPVAVADPDDVPTASLALLISPCLVFARDAHLVDAGFGRAEDWLRLVWDADELLGLDGTLFIIAIGAKSAGRWIAGSVRRMTAELGNRELVLAALLAAGTLAVAPYASRTVLEHAERVGRATAKVAGYVALGVGQVANDSGQRHASLRAASVSPDPLPGVAARMARLLAFKTEPSSLAQLAQEIGVDELVVGRIARGDPAFIFDGRGWQLGRRRLPRGREIIAGA